MEINPKITVAPKEEKSYGRLNLNSREHPFVKDLKLGVETECCITIKVKGMREADRWEISEGTSKPGDINVELSIVKIEHKVNKSKEKS